jgi:hypothetical protein
MFNISTIPGYDFAPFAAAEQRNSWCAWTPVREEVLTYGAVVLIEDTFSPSSAKETSSSA